MDALGTFSREGAGVTVEFSLVVPATPAHVWKALTDPSLISLWLASAEFNAEPGGRVHLVWNDESEMRGSVIRASPPHHLSYSWIEADGTSEISFDVKAIDSETSQLVLTHRGTSNAGAPGFGAGWHAHLESLILVLTGAATSAGDRDIRYEELRPNYLALFAETQ